MIESDVVDPELDTALRQLVRAGWNIVVCGVRTAPDALIAYRARELWADVIVLRGPDRAAAYRTLLRDGDDPLTADHVVWHCLGDAARAIEAGLSVAAEAVAERPYPIPQPCQVPEITRRPLTIRLNRRAVPVSACR